MRTFYETVSNLITLAVVAVLAYASYAMFTSGHVTINMLVNGVGNLLHAVGL